MIYFTADTHLGHQKEFLWRPRGFSSSKEHDEQIITNWNSIVNPNDDVYHLGDLMLGDNEYGLECIKQLNGKIHIILGNHDTESRIKLYKTLPNVIEIVDAKRLKYGKAYFFLCHYPVITANYDDQKAWTKHLIGVHGHTHQKEKFYNNNPYMYCVCLDAHDNKPVSIEQVIEDIKEESYDQANR
jgi:calcineurin-like phosphoesterase family protein